MLFYALQHFTPGYFRQIPIQKNEIGERNSFVLFLEQNMKSLFAVFGDGKIPSDFFPATAKRLLDEESVSRIVLNHEQANRSENGHDAFCRQFQCQTLLARGRAFGRLPLHRAR